MKFAFVCVFLCLVFFASSINAQIISGTVRDQNNAPIQNAEVTVHNQAKIIVQTTSDAEGNFTFDLQNTQNSLLLIKAGGFASFHKILPKYFNETLNIILEPYAPREEVTVSITQTATRLSETPASVVVLNREILNVTAAQNVDDVLRQVAGFQLFRRSSSKTGNPTTQGANFRGLAGSGASRASVLFDGVSINDAFGGWTYWTRVPKIAVEQIETLRGGASSFYGDQALSGAVNLQTITTKDKPVLRFETSGGSQNTFDGSIFGTAGENGFDVSGSFDVFTTEGYIPIAEDERSSVDSKANSRYQNGFLTVEKRFSEMRRVFLRGNLFAENRNNGTRLQTNHTYFRQAVFGTDYSSEKVGALTLRASIEKQIYDQTFTSIALNRNTESLSRIQRVPSQAANVNLLWSRAFSNHTVSASADFRDVRGASDETAFTNNRAASLISAGGRQQTFSISVQDFWRANKRLNLTFGARFDAWQNTGAFSATRSLAGSAQIIRNDFSDRSENTFSPRIAAMYQINSNFSVYGSFSKSFRAPTLNELYRAFRVGNVLTLANENLRAERADNYETGLDFSGFRQKLNLRGNFFVAEVAHPVVSVTLTTTPSLITRQRQNVGRTRTRGLEFDGEFLLRKNLRFSISYLLVDSRVADFSNNQNLVGKFLPQVPRQQLNFQMLYRPRSKFSFGLQGRISAAQFEDDLNTLRLDPFFTLDALASYKLPKNFEVFAAVENVFSNAYDIGLTPNRTVAAPRFVRVGLRFDLGNK